MMGKLRPINVGDRQLYYSGSGEDGSGGDDGVSALYCEFVFMEEVQPELLKRAAQEASRYIWPFRQTLVWHNGTLMYEENDADPPIFPRSSKTFYLATADTNGYLYYILYEGKSMYLCFAHGLGDAMTGQYFCHFLVHRYLSLLHPEQMPFDAEDAFQKLNFWQGEDAFDFLASVGKQQKRPPMGGACRLPKEHFLDKDDMYCMDMPREEFVRVLTELDTSPATFLMALLGRAIRKTYKVGRRNVLAFIAADLRRVFDRNTIDGFLGAANVSYQPEYDAMALKEVCARMRRDLQTQLTRENSVGFVSMYAKLLKLRESKWLSTALGRRLSRKVEHLGMEAAFTYDMTYVSLHKLQAEFGEEVARIDGYYRTNAASSFILLNREQTVSIRVTEYTGGKALLDQLRAELGALGIHSECSVRRAPHYARLDLSTLRNV